MVKLLLLLFLTFGSFAFSQVIGESDSSRIGSHKQITPSIPNLSYVTPPEGFDTSGYFHGYFSFKKRAAIVMYELKGVTPEIGKMSFEQQANYFTDNDMILLDQQDFELNNGAPAFFIKCSYNRNNETMIRFIVYAGKANSLLLDIVYPETEDLESDIINCIYSISYDL